MRERSGGVCNVSRLVVAVQNWVVRLWSMKSVAVNLEFGSKFMELDTSDKVASVIIRFMAKY